MRASVGSTYPLIGNRIGAGDMFVSWALKSVEDTHTEIFDGLGQPRRLGVSVRRDVDGQQRDNLLISSRYRQKDGALGETHRGLPLHGPNASS